jgi:hypothetical protein
VPRPLAEERNISLIIVVDFIHVAQYVWKAARWYRIVSVRAILTLPFFAFLSSLSAFAQQGVGPTPPQLGNPPRFEDYPTSETWNGMPAPVKLTTASERLFRTRLTEASRKSPNFADHYRFTFWGCGSNCDAGAVVDLQTGIVHPPPLGAHGSGWERWIISPAFFEGSGVDFRPNSRLVIVRCGIKNSERPEANVPYVYYFVWEGDRFHQLLFISGKEAH